MSLLRGPNQTELASKASWNSVKYVKLLHFLPGSREGQIDWGQLREGINLCHARPESRWIKCSATRLTEPSYGLQLSSQK